MDESELLQRCIKKDKKAWKIFFQKYSRLVYWAIHKRLSTATFKYSESEVEDIFQEVFLSLFEGNKLKKVKNIRFLPGWLSMVSSNKTTDYIRRKIRRKEELIADPPTFGEYSFPEGLLSKNTFSLVKSIIEELSHKEKMVISLNLLEEKEHKDIAQITKLPINTVSTIISRTKEKIRNKLKKMKEI